MEDCFACMSRQLGRQMNKKSDDGLRRDLVASVFVQFQPG